MKTLQAALDMHLDFLRNNTRATLERMRADQEAVILAHKGELLAARRQIEDEHNEAARLLAAEEEAGRARIAKAIEEGAAELTALVGRLGETLIDQADDASERAALRMDDYLADKVESDLDAAPQINPLLAETLLNPDVARAESDPRAAFAAPESCCCEQPPAEDGTAGDVEQPSPDVIVEDETAVLVQPHQPEGLEANPNAEPSGPVSFEEEIAAAKDEQAASQPKPRRLMHCAECKQESHIDEDADMASCALCYRKGKLIALTAGPAPARKPKKGRRK